MRIISKFHDYYDSLMAYDSDRELIYDRKVEEVIYPTQHWHQQAEASKRYPFPVYSAAKGYYRDPMPVRQRIIGFCGRLYPSLLYRKLDDPYGTPWTVCNNVEDVDEFVKAKFTEKSYEDYLGKERSKWGRNNSSRVRIREWFDEVEAKKDAYRESIFEAKYCPIFVSWYTPDKISIEYNGSLKNSEFVKVFEPWAAYQEISMFLGGLAVPQKAIPVMDDVTKAEIHGFNKHSFRKDPQS
jgi:hypothetical protein